MMMMNSYTCCSSLYTCCYIGPVGLPAEQIYIRDACAYTIVTQHSRNELIRPKEILLYQNRLKYKKSYKRELTARFLYSPRGRTYQKVLLVPRYLLQTLPTTPITPISLLDPLEPLVLSQFALIFPLLISTPLLSAATYIITSNQGGVLDLVVPSYSIYPLLLIVLLLYIFNQLIFSYFSLPIVTELTTRNQPIVLIQTINLVITSTTI